MWSPPRNLCLLPGEDEPLHQEGCRLDVKSLWSLPQQGSCTSAAHSPQWVPNNFGEPNGRILVLGEELLAKPTEIIDLEQAQIQ